MVLKKLDLPEVAIPVLGVVSTNDYSSSVKGYGLKTNRAILQNIQKTLNPADSSTFLTNYVAKVNEEGKVQINVKYFGDAKNVFIHQIQSSLQPKPFVDNLAASLARFQTSLKTITEEMDQLQRDVDARRMMSIVQYNNQRDRERNWKSKDLQYTHGREYNRFKILFQKVSFHPTSNL